MVSPAEHSRAEPSTVRARGRTGLVVCGGASRRMGVDKAGLEVGGTSLLERAVLVVAAVSDEVLLATGATARYAGLGRRIVLDRSAGLGPLAGLEAGLQAAREGWVIVLSCDMPAVTPAVLSALLERAEQGTADAVLLAGAKGVEPLCGVYHTRLAVCARAALDAGERKMTRLFAQILPDGRLPRLVAVEEREIGAVGAGANVNTAADLDCARRVAAQGAGVEVA